MPTRLLDWSLDPFVSLYFASVNALKSSFDEDDHLVLWALNRREIEKINMSMHKVPLVIINPPFGGNENLKAQQGILTYWKGERIVSSNGGINVSVKVDRTPLNTLIHENLSNNFLFKKNPTIALHKFLIPNNEAKTLFFALQKINYDAANLFPGFDGISRSIIENTLFSSN
uniref:FRG domain-containing protein n=1 Tax=Paenibacillus polymyxa TaxID=1406 RepID=A0AAE9IE73_PAEPO